MSAVRDGTEPSEGVLPIRDSPARPQKLLDRSLKHQDIPP
jgi:hypothetical protein